MSKIFLIFIIPTLAFGMEKKLHLAVLTNNAPEVHSIITHKKHHLFSTNKEEIAYKEQLRSINITNYQNKNKALSFKSNRCAQFFGGLLAFTLGLTNEILVLTSDEYEIKASHFATMVDTLAITGGLRFMYKALTNETNMNELIKAIAISKLLNDAPLNTITIAPESDSSEED